MSDSRTKARKITELDETSVELVSGGNSGAFLRGPLYQQLGTNATSNGFGELTAQPQEVRSGTTLCDIVTKTYFCSTFTS